MIYMPHNPTISISDIYNVSNYSLSNYSSRRPELPDLKSLNRTLDNISSHAEDTDYVRESSSRLSSDYDMDMGEVESWMDKSAETLGDLYHAIADCSISIDSAMEDKEDIEQLSKEELKDILESVIGNIESVRPGPLRGYDAMASHTNFIFYSCLKGIFNGVSFNYDFSVRGYEGKLKVPSCLTDHHGNYLVIKIQGGRVIFHTRAATMEMAQDVVRFSSPVKDSVTYKMRQLDSFFENWVYPQDEELRAAEVIYPGYHCDILLLMRDIIQNKK